MHPAKNSISKYSAAKRVDVKTLSGTIAVGTESTATLGTIPAGYRTESMTVMHNEPSNSLFNLVFEGDDATDASKQFNLDRATTSDSGKVWYFPVLRTTKDIVIVNNSEVTAYTISYFIQLVPLSFKG